LRADQAQEEGEDHDPQDRFFRKPPKATLRPVWPLAMRIIIAGMTRPMAPKVNTWTDTVPTQPTLPAGWQGVDQQLGGDRQIAEIHDADVEAGEGLERMPEGEPAEEQRGQQQFEAAMARRAARRAEDEQGGEQLDRGVEGGPAQDVDLEGAAHELGQRAFEHDQEGDAEQAEGHAPAEVESDRVEQEQDLGDPEQRQDDQEETVVQSIAVGMAMADQGGEQQGDDAGT
jgi:hypothetical protein